MSTLDWPLDLDPIKDPGFYVQRGFTGLYDPKVIWAKEDAATGAWLTIRATGPAMLLQWYAAPHYAAPALVHGTFCDSLDAQANLDGAIKLAENALRNGTPEAIREEALRRRETRKQHASKAATSKAEGRRASKAGSDNPDMPVGLTFNRKYWRWGPFHQLECVAFALRQPNSLNTAAVVFDPKGDRVWHLYRCWPAGHTEGNEIIQETLQTGGSWEEALHIVSALGAVEPSRWEKGNAQQLIQEYEGNSL